MQTHFECEINDLPLSIVLSWFEQKAVAILLGLFSLGIQDIRIGPKPPEFISEGVLKVLQDTFQFEINWQCTRRYERNVSIKLNHK